MDIDKVLVNRRTKDVVYKSVIDLDDEDFAALAAYWDYQQNRVPDGEMEGYRALSLELHQKYLAAAPCEHCWSGYTQLDFEKKQLCFL